MSACEEERPPVVLTYADDSVVVFRHPMGWQVELMGGVPMLRVTEHGQQMILIPLSAVKRWVIQL